MDKVRRCDSAKQQSTDCQTGAKYDLLSFCLARTYSADSKMKRLGSFWWRMWCWDSGGSLSSSSAAATKPLHSCWQFSPALWLSAMIFLLTLNPQVASAGENFTIVPSSNFPSLAYNVLSSNPSSVTPAPTAGGDGGGDDWDVDSWDTCNGKKAKIWPRYEDDPRNTSIFVGFLPTQRGMASERLGLKIPGAFSYAVDEVNSKGLLPQGYIIRYGVYDTHGSEVTGSMHIVDLICQNVSAIFGPEHTCYVEGTIAEGKNLPMISYSCSDERASKLATFARTNPSEINIIKTTVATLLHNKWKKFSILYSEDHVTMMETLKMEAELRNMTINHEIPYNKEKLPVIFRETKSSTRIYVYIGHRGQVQEILTVMAMTGIFNSNPSEQNEYLLLFVDREEYRSDDWPTYIWDEQTLSHMGSGAPCVEHDLKVYDGVFMVIANRFPEVKSFEEKVKDFNNKQPLCLGHRNSFRRNQKRPISDDPHAPYLPSAYLYDSVLLYVNAVRELFEAPNNTESVESLARNGTKIKEHIRSKKYQSILGFNISMDVNASSEGSYSVYYFSNCDEKQKLYNCSKCLIKISDYYSENHSLKLDAPRLSILDEPICKYDNSDCNNKGVEFQRAIAWVMGGFLIVLSFVTTIMYRNWKYEREIMGLQWRIAVEDLMFNCQTTAGSRQSLASALSYDMHGQWFQYLAKYKGTVVCLKSIQMNHRKPELNRETMKEMRVMREIKQDNVCSFVGAFTEGGTVTLVTEYCTRGSLIDILAMEDIKLDRLFISSLIHDLLRGMIYLHSNFGPHGNLKSSNCVVNGRWVLQITDYGLHDLQYEVLNTLLKEDRAQVDRRLLWRSPELLRIGIEAPGTKEGDVYSFAIIFHEVIGRQGPFGTYESNTDDASVIIEKLKLGSTATGTPYRPCLLDLSHMPFGSEEYVRSAMESAWDENPETRPTFKSLKLKLKNMKDKRSKGNIMDHMVHLMEQYSKNLEDLVEIRTRALREEESKTKDLLHRMLPPSVAANLTNGVPVPPKGYDAVTIYFSDIVGFTSLSASSTPKEVVEFLNDLYTLFDGIICWYDVYKVETIGDAYMVVSGLPKPNGGKHAGEIASMALELLHEVKENFQIRHRPSMKLQLRIGLHTGPVMAGVVGVTMPRYCLFGDTVNTASRMESNGEPLRIHISQECRKALENLGGYEIEERGLVTMKGKGEVRTFWLNSALQNAVQRKPECNEPAQPFLSQNNGCDNEYRRRSPRLSSTCGRTASIPRSMEDVGETSCGMSHFNRDGSPLPRDSPRSDISLHRRRLSSNLHTGSIDHNPRGSLLCPPKDSISNIVHQSRSLDQLPQTELRLEVPLLRSPDAASPSSSEPMLLDDRQRGVNFCPSANNDEDALGSHNEGENHPMLKKETEIEHGGRIIYDGENSPPFSEPPSKPSPTILSRVIGILRPNSRITSNKLTLNGLKRESLV
ncbi:receptor-type guanylate cyclase Gyc76C-like isoform X3 [Macrobrachium rosenbergii]|uniref:receptor-type guanylate cyclase Gyc76C-like isoform X3 n=2 Tax=Macrobrachium rosenbergii TaxID=79674 RepID=UPI0034D4ED5E